MSRAKRPLSFRYYDGPDIPEALLRELWELRVSLLTLTKSPEEDWAYFRKFATRDDGALLAFLDPAHRARGFFTMTYLPMEHDGRRGLLLYSKYFYFQASHRGHPMTMVAPWVLLPRAVRRYGLRRIYFVTSAFPQSYVSLARTSGNVMTLKDEHLRPWEKEALTRFATEIYGSDFDAEQGLVGNQNVADSPSLRMSDEAKALRERYEQRNPEWRDGYSLPLLFRFDAGLIWNNVRRGLRQLRRR